jgi:hypothetical protein
MAIDLDQIARRVASNRARTAGLIEFKKDQGPLRRDIRAEGYKWSPEALKNLAKILWATERSHSYGMAAYRLFSKMPASEFSPDGLLGGRGYIQSVKEMRASLGQSIELLSEFSDTVHDEVNANHWSVAQEPQIQEIIEDVQTVKADPEKFVQEQFEQEIPQESFQYDNPLPEVMNPQVTGPGMEEPVQSLPQGGPSEQIEQYALSSDYGSAVYEAAKKLGVRARTHEAAHLITGDSSIPLSTLPGPRVEHIGPGESTEEFGYFTEQDEVPSDDPLGEGFSQLDRIYEDSAADGIPMITDTTQGDTSRFKTGANTYSWLPGANNDKNMNYYQLGITNEDIEWMKANSAPELPDDHKKDVRPYRDPLWEDF